MLYYIMPGMIGANLLRAIAADMSFSATSRAAALSSAIETEHLETARKVKLYRGKPRHAYRLIRAPEWKDIERDGVYKGTTIDTRDGYLHMSPITEVPRSAERYFSGVSDLMLLEIDLSLLGKHVRWEPVASRDNTHFPHLYDIQLPRSAIMVVYAVILQDNGKFSYPPSIQKQLS